MAITITDVLARGYRLSGLKPGKIGRILKVDGDPQLALRMQELGLVCGTTVRLMRSAPLGGPVAVEVDGFLLSLRRSEADAVCVEI